MYDRSLSRVDDCICPECPSCGSVGDPKCYKEHGLVLSEQQTNGQAALLVQMAKELDEDRAFCEMLRKEADYEIIFEQEE